MSSRVEDPREVRDHPRPGAESERPEMSAGAHFAGLDGYRAVAALMVVLTHVAFSTGIVVTGGTWGHLLGRLDFGVPLFFLMSGFLLYRPWVRAAFDGAPRPSLRRYSIRRAARILPLYWVVVVVTLLVLPEIQPVATSEWWKHLLGLQIYLPGGAIEGLSQTWSLCTEISFYVALPLLAMLAGSGRGRYPWRRQLVLLATLVVVATAYNAVNVFTDALPLNAGYWLPAYLDWFAAGMLLAVLEVRSHSADPPRLVAWAAAAGRDQVTSLGLAAGLFVLAMTPIGGSYDFTPTAPWESLFKHWLYLGAAFFFLLPGVMDQHRGVSLLLSRPTPHRLGLISYGIFLWHLMLLRMIMPAVGVPYFGGHVVEITVLVISATIVVATITYRLVERPAQRWAHRR